MGDTIALENYKKSVAKLVGDWADDVKVIAKNLAPINAEIEKAGDGNASDPASRKKLDELKKKQAALQKEIDSLSEDLRVNLIVISPPVTADEKEFSKIPDWIKTIIKAKGIPLGKGVTITPKIEIDFKARKIKSFGISIAW